jgi:dynamin 1/3
LTFISNAIVQNPNMPVSKSHQQIILRASDAADKYDWLARLRAATEPSAGQGKAPRLTAASSQYLPSRPEQENKGVMGRTVAKFARFTGIGGSKLADEMAVGSVEDMEQYYERLGHFCGLYARNVYDRMAKTVPKAIILCQVFRSRDKLLDQLYNYVGSLTPVEIEFLLQEDPTAGKRRSAAQQAVKDLNDATSEVQRIQEHRAEQGEQGKGRSEAEEVSVRALLLAGAFPLVPKDRVPTGLHPGSLYGEHTPLALVAGVDIKQLQFGPPSGPKPAAANGSAAGAQPPVAAPAVVTAGPAAGAGTSATKPRRQPPPPPPGK